MPQDFINLIVWLAQVTCYTHWLFSSAASIHMQNMSAEWTDHLIKSCFISVTFVTSLLFLLYWTLIDDFGFVNIKDDITMDFYPAGGSVWLPASHKHKLHWWSKWCWQLCFCNSNPFRKAYCCSQASNGGCHHSSM